jgi:acetyl-CoA C-acetyltransferase
MAATNPDAWDKAVHTAEEITAAGPTNRPVSHPYLKLMTARIAVNQAAAAILMDAALADELGIPEEHRVSPLAGAELVDPDDVLARVAYDRSPAMGAALEQAMGRAGVTIDDCDLLELYSCFPCVPKLAIRSLGLPDETDTSVTGGLTFFGGPGNDYMLHAVVAMVRALRTGDGTTGLLYGNGGFLTKHHGLVVRAGTADQPYAVDSAKLDAELQAGIDELPAPSLVTDATGPATIEAWTVVYDPDGTPATGIAVCRVGDGNRTLANVVDGVERLLAGDPVGSGGTLRRDGDGDRNLLSLD